MLNFRHTSFQSLFAIPVVRMRVVAVAVVVMSMAVVPMIVMQLCFYRSPLRKQMAFFIIDFLFDLGNLFFDFCQSSSYPFFGYNPQCIHRSDQVVIRLTKFTIRTGIASGPIELLGIQLNTQRIFGSLTGHFIPSLQAVGNNDSQNNRRNHSPDQFESVVVRNETRFAIRTVIVLRRKPKQQGIDNEEYHEDDGHVKVHQPVDCRSVLRSRRRSI